MDRTEEVRALSCLYRTLAVLGIQLDVLESGSQVYRLEPGMSTVTFLGVGADGAHTLCVFGLLQGCLEIRLALGQVLKAGVGEDARPVLLFVEAHHFGLELGALEHGFCLLFRDRERFLFLWGVVYLTNVLQTGVPVFVKFHHVGGVFQLGLRVSEELTANLGILLGASIGELLDLRSIQLCDGWSLTIVDRLKLVQDLKSGH